MACALNSVRLGPLSSLRVFPSRGVEANGGVVPPARQHLCVPARVPPCDGGPSGVRAGLHRSHGQGGGSGGTRYELVVCVAV